MVLAICLGIIFIVVLSWSWGRFDLCLSSLGNIVGPLIVGCLGCTAMLFGAFATQVTSNTIFGIAVAIVAFIGLAILSGFIEAWGYDLWIRSWRTDGKG